MTKRNLSLAVFLLLCALSVVHSLYYYPLLPDRVASHFDSSGLADGWASKASFVTGSLIATGICALVFLGVSFAMLGIPDRFINLPNKDYWLSPEHSRVTRDSLFNLILWNGSVVIVLMSVIFHQAIRVNLGKAETLEHLMLIMGSALAVMIVLSLPLIVRFSRKVSQPSNPAVS
jgi:uncharacterized membrane protein